MITIKVLMVNVLSDGRGDLYHYIDFIKQIPSNELKNWHFIIAASGDENPWDNEPLANSTLRDTKWISQALLHSFDKDHPIFTNLTIFASRSSEPSLEVKNYLDDIAIAKKSKNIEIFNISTPIRMWPLYETSDVKVIEFLWAEHSGGEEKLSAQFSPIEYLGIYKNSVGVFLPTPENNEITSDIIQAGLQKIGLPRLDEVVPLICYGHSDMEFMLQQTLAITSNLITTKKIALLIPEQFKDDETKFQNLYNMLGDRYIVYWYDDIDDATFQYLQNKQLPIACASGDKTLEFCIATSRLPIIEIKIELKQEHLSSLINILEDFVGREPLLEEQLYAATNVINYFKSLVNLNEENYLIDRAEQTTLCQYGSYCSLVNAWQAEAEEAKRNIIDIKRKILELLGGKDAYMMVEVWRDKICPYLKDNFNANNKAAPWFRQMQNLSSLAISGSKLETQELPCLSKDEVLQLIRGFLTEPSQIFEYNPEYIQIVDKIIINSQHFIPKQDIIDLLNTHNHELVELGQQMQNRDDVAVIMRHSKYQRSVQQLVERIKSAPNKNVIEPLPISWLYSPNSRLRDDTRPDATYHNMQITVWRPKV